MSIIHHRGDPGYEAARGAMWNARRPHRFPNIIVEAETEDDVISAVKLAVDRGMKIAIRSGGHSWAATFLRDDCLLLDLSRMNRFTVDPATRSASVQPAVRGTDLNRALRKDALFFPSGHCMTVGLGGFLLQGGFGWNSRLWGPACASVTAIDVVTADGHVRHANERENADLFWAARGAGPGFFGVVTRFHLTLQSRPTAMMRSDYLYPIEALDDVLGWMRELLPSLDRSMEPLVFMRRDLFGHAGPGLLVTGPVLTDRQERAIEVLRPLETCPALNKAIRREVNVVTEFDDLMQGGEDMFYPRGWRYAADNMWTSAPAADLMPGMHRIAETLPAAPSHMMWMGWARSTSPTWRSLCRTTCTSRSIRSGTIRPPMPPIRPGSPNACASSSRPLPASSSPMRTLRPGLTASWPRPIYGGSKRCGRLTIPPGCSTATWPSRRAELDGGVMRPEQTRHVEPGGAGVDGSWTAD